MRVSSPSIIFYNTMFAIYGNEAKSYSVHAEINSITYDRYGVKVIFTLRDGSIIEGRLSNKHNFNGKVTSAYGTKTYRSYHK